MAFTIPWGKVGELVEGLEGTHKGGVQYPIPNFLRYASQFPASYQKLVGLAGGAGIPAGLPSGLPGPGSRSTRKWTSRFCRSDPTANRFTNGRRTTFDRTR